MTGPPLYPTGIADLHRSMAGHVECQAIPGIVTLVARGGDIHVDAVGRQTPDGGRPMRRDTIFRIASLTKPIAAAGTMILVDDGRLQLEDPVERWLPELANRRVLRGIDSALDDTVPARRPIAVRDLLDSCFGFGSVMARAGTHPIQKPVRDGHLGGDGPLLPSLSSDPDEWMRRLGALPLMYHPGERWTYNTSCDVLGVLVARVAGSSFEAFLRERLFEPLGMKDTAFSVPAAKVDRLPGFYRFDETSQKPEVFDPPGAASDWSRPPAFESGAGGLVSTADDYHAFCRMMLDGGTRGSKRILAPSSVEQMTRDQLTPSQRRGAEIFFGDHSSWGFGMAVNIRAGAPWVVPGRFGWDGGFGTSGYSDPQHDFIGILLTQRMMDSPEPPAVFDDFWRLAYRALPI